MKPKEKNLAIVILAAGIGSRMKSSKPKVMHELAGRPMIQWLLQTAEQLKPQKIIVVTGPDMKDLEDAVRPHFFVTQKIRNGTGGALKCALPLLKGHKGPVLVLLGDAPLIDKTVLQSLIKKRDQHYGLSVLSAVLNDPTGYGRLITHDGTTLERIVEEKEANAAQKKINTVNTGVFCIDGSKIHSWAGKLQNKNNAKEFYITDLPAIAAKDKIKTAIVLTDSDAMGCNTRSDLAMLEHTVQWRLRYRHMMQGVTLIDPSRVTFSHDTALAPNVTIEPDVFFGPGVVVERDVHIRAFSYLEGVTIKQGATIGPFARLRPETVIGEDARIGNFVEIKKSTIGAGSKIGHLAYVGDCMMGKNVNFSAGAITVNYDGFAKHKTKIGDDAMIGSNVNLVAPVTVQDGAYIAAGSTITEDVPKNALAIERGVVVSKPGWALKHRARKK